MSEEFNIFKNLDVLRNTNLLEKLKSLETANNSNGATLEDDAQDDDEFDFDSLLNNNVVKSPPKRAKKNVAAATVAEKKSKKDEGSSTVKENKSKENEASERVTAAAKKSKKSQKSRRRSSSTSYTSTDRSLSPTMPLLENLSNNLMNMPTTRTTRKAFEEVRKMAEQAAAVAAVAEGGARVNAPKITARGKGRGGGGRGRGRGRGRKSIDNDGQNNDSFIANDTSTTTSDGDNEQVMASEITPNGASSSVSMMDRFLQQGRGGGGSGRARSMRARRSYIAEIAARSNQVDFIDLVSSPLPRVEGTISLDSDGEEELPRTRSQGRKKKSPTKKKKSQMESAPSLDISLDDDNPELSVKINWKGKPEAFKLRKYQKFSTIFSKLAEREGTDLENVVFNISHRIVTADDTPDSIDYKIFQFINGRVLSGSFNSSLGTKKQRNVNQMSIKIQSDKWKRPLQIDIQKTDKFRILYIKCSEELNVAIDQIKLSFDGELLELNGTPADLDLEGGEVIDLRLKN